MISQQERERQERQSAGDLARNASMTVSEWCAHRRVSRSMFYKLDQQGLAPRSHFVGTKRLISAEADAAWIAQREADALSPEAA